MSEHLNDSEGLRALCILEWCKRTDSILKHLKENRVQYKLIHTIPFEGVELRDQEWDLILIDADMDGVDIIQFLEQCRSTQNSVPVVAFHNGARGSRDTALVRMGAFDALPKDIDRWNAEVYLDRAIAQAFQARELVSLSRTDYVTGLYNQRFLYESLKSEIRRVSRNFKDLTVALLDLDNFKSFNDTYGHLKGDKALAGIAEIIRNSIREGVDSAYRYGGDEFMIILPETNLDQAVQTVDRLLGNLAEATPWLLTFSVGLSLLSDCENIECLIRCADKSMYRAKSSGGNRVIRVACGGAAQVQSEPREEEQ
ncbi:MAG: diguanylate cyclase [bacterium]|nr:diguanylate cyclase [bacterium]MDT8365094.1 diguanylate cyclase [bacterium]